MDFAVPYPAASPLSVAACRLTQMAVTTAAADAGAIVVEHLEEERRHLAGEVDELVVLGQPGAAGSTLDRRSLPLR